MEGTAAWRVVEVAAGERQAYDALLQLADDSALEVARYRDEGELFGLLEGTTGAVLTRHDLAGPHAGVKTLRWRGPLRGC